MGLGGSSESGELMVVNDKTVASLHEGGGGTFHFHFYSDLMFTSMSRSFPCQQVLEWAGAEVGGNEGGRGGGGHHWDCSWI